MTHSHHAASYWTRRHTESVVLDIGEDVGALVLYTPPELHGHEIEVNRVCSEVPRVHSAVLERTFNGRTAFVAVFPELPPGDYEVCCAGAPKFHIEGGKVAELNLAASG